MSTWLDTVIVYLIMGFGMFAVLSLACLPS
jgi:hypothetical protein